MSKVCVECGFAAPQADHPLPPKPLQETAEVEEPERCPNCGKEGVMEDVADLPSGEDEEE